MKAIIIGAGRGSRLQHETRELPKTLVPVLGRPMLDWILEALAEAGFRREQVVFVSGYRAEVLRQRYPDLEFVHNAAWQENNILHSLLCAREHLRDGFVSTYADIVYDGAIASKVTRSPHDIALGSDIAFRRRYVDRSQHPESDAEKLRTEGSQVKEISRTIPGPQASGEFIGVMKMSAAGSARLLAAFDEVAAQQTSGAIFREGRTFQKAYLIDLLEYMVEAGVEMHAETTDGAYMEIDTLEDLGHAVEWWTSRPQAAHRP